MNDPLDPLVLERCAREGTLHQLLAAGDGRSGAAPTEVLRRAVLAAVRLDLAVIVRAPALLFTCLHHRLSWWGEPQAEAFYDHPTGQTGSFRGWFEQWRAARRERGEGGSWARSLRPPEVPVGGPLREEYRAQDPGKLLRFSADGESIGLLRPGVGSILPPIAWDRRTGRRLDATTALQQILPPPPARPDDPLADAWRRWTAAHTDTRPDDPFRPTPDHEPTRVAIRGLQGVGMLVIGVRDGDDERLHGVLARVDPPFTSATWRVELGPGFGDLIVSEGGERIAVVGEGSVLLLDPDSGVIVGRVPAVPDALAFDARATVLATLEGDRVQVWDLLALSRGVTTTLTGARRGPIAAAFSPEGDRLVTGALLCDARSGRLIARIDVDDVTGSNRISAPKGAQRLGSGRLVEAGLNRGIRVWETARGELQVEDPSRRYSGFDHILTAPDGHHYAHIRGTVDLCRVDDGRVCARLSAGLALAFARDSARVAVASANAITISRSPTGERLVDMPQPGPTEVMVWSRDGERLLAVGRDGVMRMWQTRDGRLLGEAPAPPGPASRWPLAAVEGWLGFHALEHGLSARRMHGLIEVFDPKSGRVHAHALGQDVPIADPSGRFWAARSVHFVIEPD